MCACPCRSPVLLRARSKTQQVSGNRAMPEAVLVLPGCSAGENDAGTQLKQNPSNHPRQGKGQGPGSFPLALQNDGSLENLSGKREGRNQLLLSDSGSCHGLRSRGCVRRELVIGDTSRCRCHALLQPRRCRFPLGQSYAASSWLPRPLLLVRSDKSIRLLQKLDCDLVSCQGK